jgi:hypothetical protein
MSAYMPVKHSWSLEQLRPSRSTVRAAFWVVSTALCLAAVLATLVLALQGLRGAEISQLPTGAASTITARDMSVQRDHGFIVVRGEALNQGTAPARNLLAIVELFDASGALRGVESALVQMPLVEAREESAFSVRMPDPGNVRSFRVRFRPIRASAAR